MSQQDDSSGKGPWDQAWQPKFSPLDNVVEEGGNWLPKFILWPPHKDRNMVHTSVHVPPLPVNAI